MYSGYIYVAPSHHLIVNTVKPVLSVHQLKLKKWSVSAILTLIRVGALMGAPVLYDTFIMVKSTFQQKCCMLMTGFTVRCDILDYINIENPSLICSLLS